MVEKYSRNRLQPVDFHLPSPCFRSEFYEPNALMMEEEGAVIAGLLVGLNVIDANLCMKGEDLDSQVTPPTHLTSTMFPPSLWWLLTDSSSPLR